MEIIRLLWSALVNAGTPASRIDIGHVGVFRALQKRRALRPSDEAAIIQLLQVKDIPSLRDYCNRLSLPYRAAFLRLPELFGDASVLDAAAEVLPALPEIASALASLESFVRKDERVALVVRPRRSDGLPLS